MRCSASQSLESVHFTPSISTRKLGRQAETKKKICFVAMWNHHLVVWFPESLEEHGEGRPWKSIQGSSSRIVKLAVGTLGQGLLGRCYFVSLFLLLQHTPLSSTPSLFLQHLNKNKPWICPVRCFLSLLFAYGGGSSGRTTEFPNLPLRTCSLSSEVESIQYRSFQRR